jgi:hypothetical protein
MMAATGHDMGEGVRVRVRVGVNGGCGVVQYTFTVELEQSGEGHCREEELWYQIVVSPRLEEKIILPSGHSRSGKARFIERSNDFEGGWLHAD